MNGGEKAVVRIRDPGAAPPDLGALGLAGKDLEGLRRLVLSISPLARLAMELLWGEDPGPLVSFASVEHNAVTISTDLFDAYVGDYELRPEFIISVTRDGNRFFVPPTGQRRIEVRAESDTDFFLIGVEASLTFGRADATGPVTHLILHQGGRNQTA